jgi:transposase
MKMLMNVAQVGLDSHRKFGSLTARDAQMKVIARMDLDYVNRRTLARQLGQFPPGTPVIVEGSFGWGWICDEVAQRGLSPHLASAGKVSAWRKARGKAKSNRIDADTLSILEMNDPWWEVWLAPQEVRDQRELLRHRMGLVQTQTQTKLRIHATLHRHGIIHPGTDLFGVAGHKFLNQLLAPGDTRLRESARLTLIGQLQLLDTVRGQIARFTRLFRKQLVRDPVAKWLRTIPGIGEVLAYTILAEVGDFGRFSQAGKLCSYACLVPVADDSGEDDGSAPIGRHVGHSGRRTLKWAFIEAAHAAVRKDAYFRGIFNRRTDNGQRDCNRGYIAVARHLCQVAHACVKQQRAYRPATTVATTPEAASVATPANGSKTTTIAPARTRTKEVAKRK